MSEEKEIISAETAQIQSLFNGLPEVLEFESWWNERGLKRYMLILFFPQVNQFQILVDDGKVPLTITVTNPRNSELMQAWDLYIGCVIDILGRATTLMSASIKTMHWLDENARRLWKVKLHLENKVNKFRAKPYLDLNFGLFKRLDNASNRSLGGIIDVGRVCRCINSLEYELSKFQ